jgi:hypothetical protein
MTLPADIPKVTVSGLYVASDGGATVGSVTFINNGFMTSTQYDTIVVPKSLTATLVNNAFSIDLPAGTATVPRNYKVIEEFSNPLVRREYYIDVYNQNLQLADVAPVSAAVMGNAYVTSVVGKTGAVTGTDIAADSSLRTAFDAWAGKPGMELGFAEVRTGLTASTSTINSIQDMSPFGMQITVDPINRPYALRGVALITHTVAGGVVFLRITEVSNGVDTPLVRTDFQEVANGTSGVAPFYTWCRPYLRVPPSPRARTFRLGWGITTAGTGTLQTPGTDTSGVATNGTYALEIQAVTL